MKKQPVSGKPKVEESKVEESKVEESKAEESKAERADISGAPKRPGAAAVAGKDVSLSIVKASAILKVVGNADNGRTLTEIVAATGFPTTVCHRMLATLEHERLVDRDRESGRYRLGFGLIELAHKTVRKHPIGLRTERLLAEAARKMNDVALLMVAEGEQALCIDRKEGDDPVISLGTQVGSRVPLHCGGGPFAILAFSPDEVVDRYLAQQLEKRTSRTVTDPKKIRARIKEARARGYTIGDEDLFEHVVAVAVPIYDGSGRLLGSVSVGGVKPRYNAKRIKEVGEWLRNAAVKLSVGSE